MTPSRPAKITARAPRHLRPSTRRWYEQVASQYVLEEHHLRLLRLAGEAWDRGQQARELLQKHGLTFTDRLGNVRVRPEIAVERDSRIAFARLVRELALDVEGPAEEYPRPAAIRGRAGLRAVPS